MPITGFTGTSQLDDSVAAETIADKVVRTAYCTAVADALISADSSWGGHDFVSGSTVKSFTRLGSLSAAALTQGTDGTPTALTDSQVSASVSECGVGVDYGDMLRFAQSTPGGMSKVATLMGRAYADYVDSTILGLAASFTDSVGAVDALTLDEYLQAIHELEENKAEGPFASILHTAQVHNLRAALGGSSGSTAAIFSRLGLDRIGPALVSGYVMSLFETDIFSTVNSDQNASETGWIGAMLPMSVDMPIVRVIARFPADDPDWPNMAWDGRFEYERDASGRLTEMWVTGCWGVALIAADYGVGILSTK